MCSCVFILLIFTTTLAAPRIPTIFINLLDTCIHPWTFDFHLVIMAASERGCCVHNCGKTRKDDTILHSFPNPDNDMDRYLAWASAVGIHPSMDPKYVYRNRRVCHDHFETRFLTWTRRLSPGAIPTLLLPVSGIRTVAPRTPLMDLTNIPENPINTETPSTSEDVSSTQEKSMKKTRNRKITTEKNYLLKTIKKLQIKKDNYSTRLKKALNLSENKTFQNTIKKFTTLAAMFTLMQFREIGKTKMGRRFTEPEKIMALSLYKRSPRAYRWLQKIFVLPSSMTLSRLIARANLHPGVNENLFIQLKKRVSKMKSDEKLCTLIFDEMAISTHIEYNERKDQISGFVDNGITREAKLADHALVFMIRGIQTNYKQPVAYSFCSGTTKTHELANMIKIIIRKLHSVGLCVLATVCDQGPTNVAAINLLIEETKRKYLKENKEFKRDIFNVDDKEVIPLYDPPHLIKGIRNNLLNKNLVCHIDGSDKIAKWDHIVQLYEEDPGYKGIKLIKKLTNDHINPDKFQKMKVKYATQVFSQKVGITMGFLAEKKILPAECTQTADVLIFFDELFDAVNGSYENAKKRSGKALLQSVKPRSEHHEVWNKAKITLKTMKFITSSNKHITAPTISNWLRTLNNMEYLVNKLFNIYNIKSVWMRHFNQDPLEKFFGAIRSHGVRNTNPTAAAFESSFAALLINNLSSHHSPGSNCEEDNSKAMFDSMETLFEKIEREPIHTDILNLDDITYVDFEEKKKNPRIFASLEYVTGYLLKKARTKIFKNCKKCKSSLFNNENKAEYLNLREYRKGKQYLRYPNENIITVFSKIQDIITFIIKNKPLCSDIKTYLKTFLYTELDFSDFDCSVHQSELVEFLLNLSCKFFIFNWCKDVNKIINGQCREVDDTDTIKQLAFNHYNKKKHYKKTTR